MTHERKTPLRLEQEKALARRIPEVHPQLPKILNSIEAKKAGFRGEQNLDYHLTFLPSKKYTILRGIRLTDQYAFQIDTLLISPWLIILIESKNYSGLLFFDKHSNQLIRTIGASEEGFPNPLLQAQRQVQQLKNWLALHKLPPIPIEYIVTISQSKTIIKSNHPEIFHKVVHDEQVVEKIGALEKCYPTPMANEKTIRKIIKLILKEDAPLSSNILEAWKISPLEIIPGVQCPFCHKIPMTRIFGTWYCPFCKSESKSAHIQTISDYFYLMGSTITNRQCRSFLLLPSRRTSEQLLKSMHLEKVGSNKGVFYTMPLDRKM